MINYNKDKIKKNIEGLEKAVSGLEDPFFIPDELGFIAVPRTYDEQMKYDYQNKVLASLIGEQGLTEKIYLVLKDFLNTFLNTSDIILSPSQLIEKESKIRATYVAYLKINKLSNDEIETLIGVSKTRVQEIYNRGLRILKRYFRSISPAYSFILEDFSLEKNNIIVYKDCVEHIKYLYYGFSKRLKERKELDNAPTHVDVTHRVKIFHRFIFGLNDEYKESGKWVLGFEILNPFKTAYELTVNVKRTVFVGIPSKETSTRLNNIELRTQDGKFLFFRGNPSVIGNHFIIRLWDSYFVFDMKDIKNETQIVFNREVYKNFYAKIIYKGNVVKTVPEHNSMANNLNTK